MQRILSSGSRGARWILVGALALTTLALIAGCDRTRPYGAAAEPVTGGGDAPAVSVPTATAAAGGPVQTADGWKFTFNDPGAGSVSLAGSFNGWNTDADPLKKGADGLWVIVKPLPTGTHQYKFVVNGSDWKEDPNNPNSEDDGYGGKNSSVVVP